MPQDPGIGAEWDGYMAYISVEQAAPVTDPPAPFLMALSGVLMFAGSALITIAALIAWWPVAPVVFVLGAVLFWTYAALTAKDDPTQPRLVLQDA